MYELNMDGLVGPTHHYAGLSFGNVASITHRGTHANPKMAAIQGLHKMRFLHDLGLKQAVIPPHFRPCLPLLRQLGFTGNTAELIARAFKEAPMLLSAAYSASSMWAANTATVSSSLDSSNHKVNFTPANLLSNLHRQQEATFSSFLLHKIFHDDTYFLTHPSLPNSVITADEGAANHCRISQSHGEAGVNLFVYGKEASSNHAVDQSPKKFPPRQTLEASMAIARGHSLDPDCVVFAKQNPKAIDQGVFHNDVVAVANESVLLIHEEALAQQKNVLRELVSKAKFDVHIIEIKSTRLSVAEAVQSYLFNSQILTLPDGSMLLLAPKECEEQPRVVEIIAEIINDTTNPINQVYYFDLKQSMQNGGGPACLRLRVPLQSAELAAMHQGVLLNSHLIDELIAWVNRHYRDELSFEDLSDPQLFQESMNALDDLTSILQLGSIYPFQLEGNYHYNYHR